VEAASTHEAASTTTLFDIWSPISFSPKALSISEIQRRLEHLPRRGMA